MSNKDRMRPDGFDVMWSFLLMGGQKANIPVLKENCAMLQKTAGQRANKPDDVDWTLLDATLNIIVIEAMALYLSGDLDKLEGLP